VRMPIRPSVERSTALLSAMGVLPLMILAFG